MGELFPEERQAARARYGRRGTRAGAAVLQVKWTSHAAAPPPRTRSGTRRRCAGTGGRADALVRGDRRAGAAAQPEADSLGGPPGRRSATGASSVTTKREDGQAAHRRAPPRAAEGGAGEPHRRRPVRRPSKPASKPEPRLARRSRRFRALRRRLAFDAAVAKEKAAAAAALRRGLACPPSSAAKWRSNRRVPRPARRGGRSPAQERPGAVLRRHETLNKILDNVTANPGDDKYRRLKRSNPVLNMKVFSAKGSERFLQCVGFVEQRDEKDGTVFVLRAEGEGHAVPLPEDAARGQDALEACKATFHPRDLER